MSAKHPIIAVTGSSGAGTTSVMRTFEQIFRRDNISAGFIDGDSFHRYDRAEMKQRLASALERGDHVFSHFGPEANLFADLEGLFRDYGQSGTGRVRWRRGAARGGRNVGGAVRVGRCAWMLPRRR